LRTQRKGLVAPIQNASISVSEVMVMDTAVALSVLASRTSVSSRESVALHTIISWNMSSAPIPVRASARAPVCDVIADVADETGKKYKR